MWSGANSAAAWKTRARDPYDAAGFAPPRPAPCCARVARRDRLVAAAGRPGRRPLCRRRLGNAAIGQLARADARRPALFPQAAALLLDHSRLAVGVGLGALGHADR